MQSLMKGGNDVLIDGSFFHCGVGVGVAAVPLYFVGWLLWCHVMLVDNTDQQLAGVTRASLS
jgi:hypothetical protein